MTEKRIIRKLKKLASRINNKIESVRDEMDDLEIDKKYKDACITLIRGCSHKVRSKQRTILLR